MYLYLLSLHVWRRTWHPTPVLLPGKSHGWRSLVGYSPWGREESDTTERLHFIFHFQFSLSCIGEGNGNPLQYSCLEKPRDRGAWWAAVYGVAQSQTQLKWLSSSSSLRVCVCFSYAVWQCSGRLQTYRRHSSSSSVLWDALWHTEIRARRSPGNETPTTYFTNEWSEDERWSLLHPRSCSL